jgi:acetate kinase
VRVLVVNAGSTSLKLSVVGKDDTVEQVEALDRAGQVEAVGHRVVHGGARFAEPVVVDDAVERELESLTELAPLHNAPALDALRRARAAMPGVPQVAVFDTAFHTSMPAEAVTYALPRRLRALGIRRFGFHGLSVRWAAGRVRAARLVVCHLGGGCSVTAVLDGRSVDTTMGYTPLEGVPMATRSGSVDPGALLALLRDRHLSVEELEHALEHESGLYGLGGTGDVAVLERAADDDARLALAVFTHRVGAAVAAMAASLDGLDALVFTGGIGEHSALVRRSVCERLRFLGVDLDHAANEGALGDGDIGGPASAVRVAVVRSREELVIAQDVRGLVAPV